MPVILRSTKKYLIKLVQGLTPESIGNKAFFLIFIHKNKFRIPKTYVITAQAFSDYLENEDAVLEKLRSELATLPDRVYAVRSSTLVEDSANHSYAGQFQTYTNISGTKEILDAIVKVWESAFISSQSEYHQKVYTGGEKITFAVILQEMVRSKLSGVSFSKNPVTGQNEIVIEAIEGMGEDLVQKGLTPFRWRISRKKILEGPSDYPNIDVIKKVAVDTARLKKLYGNHVDIEWAFDNKALYYLQLRGIVGNECMDIFSSKMAQEMLPGQIKPLVWSINIPLVNGSKINLLSEVFGPLKIEPEDLARSFYYRIYFNMTKLGEIFKSVGLPPESLENMMGDNQGKKHMVMPGPKVLRHAFRLIRFLYSKMHYEKTYLAEYPELRKRFIAMDSRIRNNFSIDSFAKLYDELYTLGQKVAYVNTVVPVLMRIYNRKLSKRLKKIDVSYDLLDFQRDFPELAKYSPFQLMEGIRKKYEMLPDHLRIQADSLSALSDIPEAVDLIKDFQTLLSRFGHLSDSGNDCSVAKWEENPEQLYKMALSFSATATNRDLIAFDTVNCAGTGRRGLRKLFTKAGKFKLYREQISSLYIYGYGLFRTLFLALADELVRMGIIVHRDDIFYLTLNEIRVLLENRQPLQPGYASELIAERKKEMADCADLILPAIIYGTEAPILERGSIKNFTGIGTSPGTYRGLTRIIRKTSDFDQINRGEVLIIPFSDVSWSPVLSMAGAIVSESGGMLSHCSIISRELGIPSLVSVENACSLDNGLLVTVDGSNGILTIHDYE